MDKRLIMLGSVLDIVVLRISIHYKLCADKQRCRWLKREQTGPVLCLRMYFDQPLSAQIVAFLETERQFRRATAAAADTLRTRNSQKQSLR
jgi:hypothetical protein